MHGDIDINIEEISKTEGHTGLEVKVRDGKVEYVKLKVSENKRFFTQGVIGKKYFEIPSFISRICGTCSIAHLFACIEAVEKAFGIEVSEQTKIMRKLSMFGLMIRDHGMHLYFLSLPDVMKKDSIFEIGEENPNIIKEAFEVKAAGNLLCKVIAGRAIHPTFATVGGFLRIPKNDDIKNVLEKLKNVRNNVLNLIEIFGNSSLFFEKESLYVALCTPHFNFLEGEIRSSDGIIIREENYWNFVNRVVIPYSQSTAFKFTGKPYRVGALARLNLNKDELDEDTKKDAKKYIDKFPSNNIFDNNLAQAIEILHCIDSSIKILESFEFKEEKPISFKIRENEGIGVLEAPRGTLYHMYYFNSEGKVKFGNFVIPTAQNQIHMELDIKDLIEQNLDKNKHELQHMIEALIRAYDPCFSCASHFLKIKWI
ncbi:MAG: Ni/Fe hydrogenase subunit alpha [Candidatus Aenigmarchaeota archaeon]|nr:Ni/Fe hydrogenase subunit alpha [Candidatus Aenigmarchaeota archaeon]MDW8149445.1 Ni/Fe hydrogenase subunit alpha [Candidatus Aenigmarchaeota archaeon]